MARRGEPTALQDLTRDEICKLTLRALGHILQQEKEDQKPHRKRAHSCDRKQQNLPASKKHKSDADDNVQTTSMRGRRGQRLKGKETQGKESKRGKEEDRDDDVQTSGLRGRKGQRLKGKHAQGNDKKRGKEQERDRDAQTSTLRGRKGLRLKGKRTQGNDKKRGKDQDQDDVQTGTLRGRKGLRLKGKETQGRDTKRTREQDEVDGDAVDVKRRRVSAKTSHTDGPSTSYASEDQELCFISSSEAMEELILYLSDLTPSIWTLYANSLIEKVMKKLRFELVDKGILEKTIELTFTGKLLSFSTLVIESYASDLKETFYDHLKKCIRMEALEVTIVPSCKNSVMAASFALRRMHHIHSLSLLPPTRYSYHWAIGDLARYCHTLRELKIVYNGDLFDGKDELRSLQLCSGLISLWLFNFGRSSETKEVSQLIQSLENLKILYHKELPNAIMGFQNARGTGDQIATGERTETGEQTSRGQQTATEQTATGEQTATQQTAKGDQTIAEDTRTSTARQHLQLERVDLCWHQRAVGYQLVYVPSFHLLQVAKVCPKLRILNLVGPPCLAHVLQNLPSVHVLILQQASLQSCLSCSLNNLDLGRITELRLTDVWDVTHDIISAMSRRCPCLKVLNVINSSLEARGDLQIQSHRAPFPNLCQVILVPVMIHSRPPLTTPSVWQLGAQLTSYILNGASQLTHIHLHYKLEDILEGDILTAQDLENVLSFPRPALRTLQLEWPPVVSPSLVGSVLRACNSLTKLSSIITWPLTSDQRADIVTRYGLAIDID